MRRRSSSRGLLFGTSALLACSFSTLATVATLPGQDKSTAVAATTPLTGSVDLTAATASVPNLQTVQGIQLAPPPSAPSVNLPPPPSAPPLKLSSPPSPPAVTVPQPSSNALSPVTSSPSTQQGPGTTGSGGQTRSERSATSKRRAAVGTRRLRRTVYRLRGCLGALSSIEKRVLVMRSGLSVGGTRTEGETAGLLGIRLVRVQRLERRALGDLRAAVAAGGCDARGGQSAAILVGSSRRFSSSFTGSPWTVPAARPVGLFAAPFAAPIGASRHDDPPTHVLFGVALAALLLTLGCLLGEWRDRRRARQQWPRVQH
jgi:hypothetical protein